LFPGIVSYFWVLATSLSGAFVFTQLFAAAIAVFPILADPVDVKRGDQQCETASQPSTQPDKVD